MGKNQMTRTAKIALFAGVLLAPMTAFAQTVDPVETVEASAQTEVDSLVVTAQKREERLLDVGVNVSALPTQVLEDRRVNQITDLLGLVPNIDIKEQVPGAMPVVTIRGVGLDDFSATNNPTAGIYVDEVFLASTAMMSSELFDLERVEVLKGPQGTLYGRNTTAGALNIITAKPRHHFEAAAKAGYGNYDTFEAEGMINLPIGETAAFRASGRLVRQGEGYWTSRLLPGETIGERDILTGRLQLAFEPTDRTYVNLKLEGLRSRSEMGQNEFFGVVNPLTGGPCAPFLAGQVDNSQCTNFFGYSDVDGDPFTGDWPRDAFYDIDAWDATATLGADLGWGKLTSITGYRVSDRAFDTDVDANPARQLDFIQTDRIEQFSQEVRLNGSRGAMDWIAGAFYSHDEVTVFTPGDHRDFFVTQTLVEADQETDAAAVFLHADWRLSERLKLITGVRYTEEERSYVGGTRDLNPLGFSALCGGCALPYQLTFTDTSIEDENVTWKIGLDFKPTDQSLIYASISKGVKSGGFFSGITTDNAQLAPFAPEELIAYEVGAKAELFERRVLVTGSAFYYDYSDVQTFIIAQGIVPVQKLDNVDEATVKGLDLDVLWLPTRGLTVRAGLGLLDTELGAFSTLAGPIPAGNRLPNAPDVSFTGSVKYAWTVGTLEASVQAGAAFTDKVFKDASNDPVIAADSHWLYDARATLRPSEGPWELAVWGKNLSDEQYVVQGLNLSSLGMGNRGFNAPRTYGVSLTMKWR
jgi:iron complex outermembrane recepter protein